MFGEILVVLCVVLNLSFNLSFSPIVGFKTLNNMNSIEQLENSYN